MLYYAWEFVIVFDLGTSLDQGLAIMLCDTLVDNEWGIQQCHS